MIVVTTPTGAIGRQVLANLLDRDAPVRLIARDPSRLPPLCATRDIAAAAADLLLDGTWSGQGSVAVLGPEDLSADDMVRIMSEVLDRPVRFERISDEDYLAGLRAYGVSEAMARAMVDMVRAKDAGLDAAEPRTPGSSSPRASASGAGRCCGPRSWGRSRESSSPR